ncbi:FecR family protein [Pedobacter panaciterrae]
MTIKNEHIVKLAAKWEAGTISEAEQLELDNWYRAHQDDPLWIPEFLAASEDEHQVKIWNAIQEQIQVKRVRLWPRIAAAASIILAISVGIFFYTNQVKKDAVETGSYVNDVAPGKQGATLTLANGRKISLSDAANGELAKEAGVVITKSANGQLVYKLEDFESESNKINTLSTAKGETYQVRLPDGSLVWLNAASSLTYSTALTERRQRRVKLSGEAYFEVAKDKTHPFVVESRGQEVEVLGTHFNVNAYGDEPAIATTLLEGSVQVTSGKNQQILKPGFQAINSGSSIKVTEADIENTIDWKEGDFYFENADFRSVMRKIGRWYDVDIIYDPSVPETITSNGVIPRNNKLSAVLKSIENSGQVHFRIDGNKIYVTK